MPRPFLLASLLGLPLLATAQTAPAPHFYAGAGVTLLTPRPFNSYDYHDQGPTLTAGYQLTPRLAVQLSGAYTWRNREGSYSTFDPTYGPAIAYTEASYKLYTLPLLLRATLTAPASRWHVDALGGVIFQHSTASYFTRLTSPTGTDYSSERSKYADTTVSLALGPGVRYSPLPQLDIVLNALVDYNLKAGYTTTSDRFTSNLSAGLLYNFNQ